MKKQELQDLLQSWRKEAEYLSDFSGCDHGWVDHQRGQRDMLLEVIKQLEKIVPTPPQKEETVDLPDCFTFVHSHYPTSTIYTAKLEDPRYKVSWTDVDGYGYVYYGASAAKSHVETGKWVIKGRM